ncbi:hypothetical protein CYMTET_16677, partial [Cymbomonas tetramitiformis]
RREVSNVRLSSRAPRDDATLQRKLTVADWPEQVCYLDTCRYLLGDENAKDAHAAILNLLGQLPAHLLNLLSSAMEMLSSRQQTDEEADAARESGEAESMNHGSTAYGSATSSTAERMRRGRVASTAVSTEEAGIQAAAVSAAGVVRALIAHVGVSLFSSMRTQLLDGLLGLLQGGAGDYAHAVAAGTLIELATSDDLAWARCMTGMEGLFTGLVRGAAGRSARMLSATALCLLIQHNGMEITDAQVEHILSEGTGVLEGLSALLRPREGAEASQGEAAKTGKDADTACGSPGMVDTALGVLSRLASHPDGCMALASTQGIVKGVMSCLSIDGLASSDLVVAILAYVAAAGPEARTQIATDMEGLGRLASRLQAAPHEPAAVYIAATIGNIAEELSARQDGESEELASLPSLASGLAELVLRGDSQAAATAAGALRNLAGSTLMHPPLLAAKELLAALEAFLRLPAEGGRGVADAEEGSEEAAVWEAARLYSLGALGNLAQSSQGATAMGSRPGVVAGLTSLLCSEDATTATMAVGAIRNLVTRGDDADSREDAGEMHAISSNVLEAIRTPEALEALRALARGDDADASAISNLVLGKL